MALYSQHQTGSTMTKLILSIDFSLTGSAFIIGDVKEVKYLTYFSSLQMDKKNEFCTYLPKEYKKYSLNTFSRVCKSSRTVFVKQKNDTLRRYNTYENYLNAQPYFNKIA